MYHTKRYNRVPFHLILRPFFISEMLKKTVLNEPKNVVHTLKIWRIKIMGKCWEMILPPLTIILKS